MVEANVGRAAGDLGHAFLSVAELITVWVNRRGVQHCVLLSSIKNQFGFLQIWRILIIQALLK